MYFFHENVKLLKKYNDTWNKVSNIMKKEFDSEPIYTKTFSKTKIKICDDNAKDFHDKETPKVVSNHTCLEGILIYFVFKKNENYYPQFFLKECKYIEKKKTITNNLLISSDDSTKNYFESFSCFLINSPFPNFHFHLQALNNLKY